MANPKNTQQHNDSAEWPDGMGSQNPIYDPWRDVEAPLDGGIDTLSSKSGDISALNVKSAGRNTDDRNPHLSYGSMPHAPKIT